jgi:hypothetical protein
MGCKHKLAWPAVGQAHPVQVYLPPERAEGETDDEWRRRLERFEQRRGVVAHVRLQPPGTRWEWEESYQRALAAEAKRAKGVIDAGGDLPQGMTREGWDELRALSRRFIVEGLERLEGVVYGGVDLATVGAKEALADALESTGLLGPVAMAVRRGQHPTPEQLDS